VIAAAGDIACASSTPTSSTCHHRATSDLIAGSGFDALLDLGDNQYDVGALSAYNTYYDPTWGRAKPSTHPVPGNHEYGTANAAGYFGYFGSKAGDPSKGYYSYDIGAWHVIALNSNCSNVGGCGSGSPEEQWLRADLAAHPAACTVAYWHHPRFSSGTEHGSDTTYTAFWQALYDGGAEVVLNGHEHNYERFAPQTGTGEADANGIREFVVGTGGASHYEFGTPIANSQVRNSTTFGILKLMLHPSGYDWEFVPEAGSTFVDSGSSACH
jgi:acid phosphatase type 7